MSCDIPLEELIGSIPVKDVNDMTFNNTWYDPEDKMPDQGRDCIIRGYTRERKVRLDEAVFYEGLGWITDAGRVTRIRQWRYKNLGEWVHPSGKYCIQRTVRIVSSDSSSPG